MEKKLNFKTQTFRIFVITISVLLSSGLLFSQCPAGFTFENGNCVRVYTANATLTVPADATELIIECWGGGGGGGGAYNNGTVAAGGGGGGGAYSRSTVQVVSGENLVITRGAGGNGGSWSGGNGGNGGNSSVSYNSNVVCLAVGGARGIGRTFGGNASGGAGGNANNGVGDVRFSGGNGRNGGAGGGAGGTTQNGSSSSGNTGGSGGNAGGGSGGNSPSWYGPGSSGNTYGGGGGGAKDDWDWGYSGGSGANGAIRISYNPCTPPGDPLVFGEDSWIGYVYQHNNAEQPNPAFTIGQYRGFVTEPETFDRDWGSGGPSGSDICGSYDDRFHIRYRMRKNMPCGNYVFTIGADDGIRLSVDGGNTWLVEGWVNQGYTTYTSSSVYLNGNVNFVLEYYEDGGGARASFDYTFTPALIPSVPDLSDNSPICIGETVDLTASGLAPGGQFGSFNASSNTNSTHYTSAPNNFTMELWARPTGTIVLYPEANTGISANLTPGSFDQKNIVFPANAGGDNSGAGISLGTNGVAVYEHGPGYYPSILVWEGSITDWTHIAVVYDNKTSSLYINGVLVKTGLTSQQDNVYPSAGVGSAYGNYLGEVDNYRIWSTVKSSSDIIQDMYLEEPANSTGLVAHYKFNGNTNADVGNNLSNNGGTFPAANYYTYTWSGVPSAPSPGTSETQTTGVISNGGLYDATTVTASTPQCEGTESDPITVTVNELPTISSIESPN